MRDGLYVTKRLLPVESQTDHPSARIDLAIETAFFTEAGRPSHDQLPLAADPYVANRRRSHYP